MTATTNSSSSAVAPVEEITLTIDGLDVSVPKGTLVIRAAETVGIQIPRFCDHPLLKPAGACRQCLVDIATPDREGNLRPMPKPQASCTIEATPGMVVNTQHTSAVAEKAQRGQIEFLLVNHPLDCPVCDKGGECPLQNQAMSNGSATSRFVDIKRTFPKPIKISTQILLDRDRCILCQRCTRFSAEIAGDPFIDLQGRGGGAPGGHGHGLPAQQIGRFDEAILEYTPSGDQGPVESERTGDVVGPYGQAGVLSSVAGSIGGALEDTSGRPFASYFSGNTIQICPVGALTSAAYRFRSRPFDLVSTASIAEHDACGSAIRIDHRRGVVLRRLAGDDPAVNEEWITDKDRFAFAWQTSSDVLTAPLVRDEETGELVPTSWSEAIGLAADGLRRAGDGAGAAALPGGRLTLEDAYAWSKFTRTVLGTNDIDFRARVHSAEEADFLANRVAGSGLDVTFGDLERAPRVLLVGLEPEEEAGTVFLRLRKGMLAGRVQVTTIAPLATRGSTKLRAELVRTAPGEEPSVLDALAGVTGTPEHLADLRAALAEPGTVVLAGERLAGVPGALSALDRLVSAAGARFAWVPRRAGDRGAVEVGLLPGLLPGGRPTAEAEARVDVASVWGVSELPAAPGRDLTGILDAATAGEIDALVVGGIDLEDLPSPAQAEVALAAAGFVVQLEVRRSAVTQHADIVLPIAPTTHKSGTFLNWEGRPRPFGQVFTTSALTDARVLGMLADAVGVDLGTRTLEDIHRELAEFDGWEGPRTAAPAVEATPVPALDAGQVRLATWRLMLDSGRGQDGEPHLAGTAYRPVALLSPATAATLGLAEGDRVRVTGPDGDIVLPVLPTPMGDDVVWLPQHSPGSSVHRTLGATAGAAVRLTAVDAEVAR
ncbi:NADH-quinone oxidoreductase subunit G [Occultella glacieicola]|uniref:NADH-quinone oxidoreductase subunit G n=1 Tax=Occultella glacieicola TaxID=2518684 RepID=A0ABY2E1B7_9MICO|nr:NADH-quinone oxidoreductase subunit G [Occultella glacieicola]TDE91718.1 NADH-quinone oxidoreductase subunit G [Occultella glacieicola]